MVTFPERRYFLSLNRPGSSTRIVQPDPTYPISRQIKALKNFRTGSTEHFSARSVLGKAFGTKKVKTAIQARKHNKVDVSAMEDVVGMLQDQIYEKQITFQLEVCLVSFMRNVLLTPEDGQKK